MTRYIYITSKHEAFGPTLHITKDARYPEVLDPNGAFTAPVDWTDEQIKAISFFAKHVMNLHVCRCEDA